MLAENINFLGLPRAELEALVKERFGAQAFRARQLMKWIYKRGVGNFAAMSDLSKDFRIELERVGSVRAPEIASSRISADGTRKWLLRMDETQGIETVFIPEADRGTLCISSQVGCAMDCSFCATAQQGFNRNLSSAEIVGQVWLAQRELAAEDAAFAALTPAAMESAAATRLPAARRRITNVVFMGMGEPLANYRNVVRAIDVLVDDLGYELSRRRVTLSTSGLVPQIYKLAEDCNVALAVSLHAPNDALRNELVPINRKHPIAELLAACWHYLEKQNGRNITFEYVMLDGVNDSIEHARELARLLEDHAVKLNLIPFNPFPGTAYRRSSARATLAFRDVLNDHSIIATIRKTRGEDIDAACGQLAGRVLNRASARLSNKRMTPSAAA